MLRTMACGLIALAVMTSVGQAQDWQQELSEDLVTIEGGKMVLEDFGIIQVAFEGYEPVQHQVKVHAEAPEGGVVTRDNFVAITTTMAITTWFTMFAEGYQASASDYFGAVSFTDLDAPIGNPDLELNIYMTDEGMQFEVVNTQTGQRTRQTMTWAEWFQD